MLGRAPRPDLHRGRRPYAPRVAMELDPTEQRVMGSLLEKERTVPDTYPMTLNGLRTACNQTSGRDPILSLSEVDVQAALDRLRPRGLTRVVHPSHGARQPKHRQVLDEVLHLTDGERAVLTLLLLRGPQTPGELRSRADRLHRFADLDEVDAALGSLAARDDPLVQEQDRRRGQKERRWTHLLGPGAADAPGPDPVSAARVADVYSTIAGGYADELVDELDRKPFDRWLLERLAVEAGDGPVADVGCGPGHITAHLAAAGADATGFDVAEGMVAEARRRFPELAFEVADLHRLPPPAGGPGWSLITAWYALVHCTPDELPTAIAALAASLRPGGCLAVALHEGSEVRRLADWFGHRVDLTFTFHEREAVVDAFEAAGLVGLEWYVRNHTSVTEAATQRVYVVGHRPPVQP
jgi:uncharacterized protein YceH (UPF0502 family)